LWPLLAGLPLLSPSCTSCKRPPCTIATNRHLLCSFVNLILSLPSFLEGE
jgi:hypothetical protein